MFHNVLVPLDDSPTAEDAIATAADVSSRTGGILHIVHVAHQSMDTATTLRRSRRLAETVRKRYGIPVDAEIVACDPQVRLTPALIATEVEQYAATHAIALIVMTSRCLGGVERMRKGSVADSLIRITGTPVLILKSPTPVRGLALDFQNILVAMDASPSARDLAAKARTLGTLFEADITGIDVDCFSRATAADAIIAQAVETGADAIAVGTRTTGELRRMLVGSVADRIIRASPIPVLVCNYAPAATVG